MKHRHGASNAFREGRFEKPGTIRRIDPVEPFATVLQNDPLFLTLTTSLPQGAGSLVRLAAWRPSQGEAGGGALFERLAKPAQRLTLAQARSCGLTNAALDEAPELGEVLQDLVEFSDAAEAWLVPEGAPARDIFTRAAREAGFPRGFGPPLLGADELGRIVRPTACRRFDDLVAAGASEPLTPQALAALWAQLEAELVRVPLPVLAEMNWLLSRTRHPLKPLLKAAESAAVEAGFGAASKSGKLSLAGLFKDQSEIVERLQIPFDEPAPDADDAGEPPAVPIEALDAFFGPGGKLAQRMANHEERPEQRRMAERVAAAFGAGRHLIAEAGTGVGKSLAYLAPAVLFARQAGRPLVVSTHTKNLQAQLFHKDIPLLREALGEEFEAALLKGRPNYLCARKFMYTLQESAHELTDEEREAMLPVMNWAVSSEEGDVAELAAFSPEQHPELWDRLHTVGEDCMGRQCPFYHRCFVYRARGLARTADLVVCNHALVFSDLNREHGSLPPYREIVFDEAHTLEDVATEFLACELTPRRAYRILNRLFRAPQGSAAGKGLLPSILFHLEQGRGELPAPLRDSIHEHALQAIQAVAPAAEATDFCFDGLRAWFERRQEREADDGPAVPFVPREPGRGEAWPPQEDDPFALRAAEDTPRAPAFQRPPRRANRREPGSVLRFASAALLPDERHLLDESKEAAIAGLGRLRQALGRLDEDFKELKQHKMPRARELHKELSAQNLFLQELIADLEFVIKADEPNYVYWMERLGRRALRVVGAPLDLSALLHEQLYAKKRSVVLSSATLSVRDTQADGSGFAPLRRLPRPHTEAESQSEIQNQKSEMAAPPHPKSFEFLKLRLGLSLCAKDELDELLEGSPFDYENQCRLYVPTFLPEPGGGRERAFNEGLAGLIAPLALAAGGRTLALYTSYESLKRNAEQLKRTLGPEGLEVVAQGEDGSREALLAKLKNDPRTVLLGTSSFWEGVDVQGEALSLLVIAKLPFAVFTDPLVEGRCELLEAQGKDPFLHFSVPNAILRLRQGFGRLIRSRRDRGVVILGDKRVLTKRYGAAFLRALPVQARKAHDPAQLAAEVEAFLKPPASGA